MGVRRQDVCESPFLAPSRVGRPFGFLTTKVTKSTKDEASQNEARDPGYSQPSVNLEGVTDRSIGKLVEFKLRALHLPAVNNGLPINTPTL